MIYLIVKHLRESGWLEAHDAGYLNVFTGLAFQSLAALVVAFLILLLLGPWVIRSLQKLKIGDLTKFDQAEMDKLMAGKKGVPTMGGVLIIAAIVAAVALLADMGNFYVQMALVCVIWLGAIGATDDWLKLTAGRRAGSRQGLSSKEKLLFQLGLSLLLAYFTWKHGVNLAQASRFHIPFVKDYSLQLNLALYVIIATLVMTGSSNAVNLTDGLDGLAAGCMGIVSFSFMVLANIIGTSRLARYLLMPEILPAGQMAVIAGAMTGACLGFLWFNCHPARVFMGDTGSLALGGLIGYVAIVIRQELVLFLVGGIFVVEALSVMMQVSWFKYTRKRFGEGRRIFLMAPLHHHFQRKGWTETQVVVRFWLIGAMLAAMGLATVKLR